MTTGWPILMASWRKYDRIRDPGEARFAWCRSGWPKSRAIWRTALSLVTSTLRDQSLPSSTRHRRPRCHDMERVIYPFLTISAQHRGVLPRGSNHGLPIAARHHRADCLGHDLFDHENLHQRRSAGVLRRRWGVGFRRPDRFRVYA